MAARAKSKENGGLMRIELHPHAHEPGATEAEVVATVQVGEQFPARFGRVGFRRNFSFNGLRRGRHYATKQVEAYAVQEEKRCVMITVIVRYF
jgi:hypothetical protein